MQQRDSNLTPDQIEGLLQTSQRAVQAGNIVGARALLRLLIQQQPDEQRAWRWLADIAETDEERQHALERLAALNASGTPAHYADDQDHPSLAPQPPIATSTPPPANSAPMPLLRMLSLPFIRWGLIALTGSILLLVLWWLGTGTARAPVDQYGIPLPPTIEDGSDAAQAVPTVPGLSVRQFEPTNTPANVSTPFPLPVPVNSGSVLEEDSWQATLIRPEHIQIIEDDLGGRQPEGRFVLAVVAIGNLDEVARRIPPDFFVLIDDQGRSYRVATGASTTYLATYGRGQRGDLALEDSVPAGGMFSMPLIFDVPVDATGLVLTMTRNPDGGWPVLESVPPASESEVPPPTVQTEP